MTELQFTISQIALLFDARNAVPALTSRGLTTIEACIHGRLGSVARNVLPQRRALWADGLIGNRLTGFLDCHCGYKRHVAAKHFGRTTMLIWHSLNRTWTLIIDLV
jgi:hypothetical protein